MHKKSKRYRKIARDVGRAVHRYRMIEGGDRIAVGLSGGKDSLTLLHMLSGLKKKAPVEFTLFPVFIDPGFEGGFAEPLRAYCEENGFSLVVDHTDHGIEAHKGKNPCFICSRLRRKRLFEIADDLGCYKLALGHNRDDLIETLFLNMLYAGQLSTMLPNQSIFEDRFNIIRPLAHVDEDLIRAFAEESNFPVFTNTCPSAKISKRKEVKELLNGLYASDKNIKGNIFRAMENVRQDYLLK